MSESAQLALPVSESREPRRRRSGMQEPRERRSIDDRFLDFHRANPHVFRLFVQYALEAIGSGAKHFSADAVCHRIRWHRMVEIRSSDEFKLNNDFTSRYARMFAARYPQHGDFFETRRIRAVK